MPFIQVNTPTGAVPQEKKQEVVSAVTSAITSSMGVPAEAVHVHLNEVSQGGYATGGQVLA